MAIRIVANGDTIRISQFGDLDTLFDPVIEALQNFIDKGEHQKIQARVLLETKSVVMPPPPLFMEEIKFTDPEEIK